MLQLKTIQKDTFSLLKALSTKKIVDSFALAGGTALALFLGHRISIDLDFFTSKQFDSCKLLDELNKSFTTQDASLSPNALSLSIVFQGTVVKVDFIRHNYHLLSPIKRVEGIKFYSIKDIAAMKLNAIANRGAKKDFYDIHALLSKFSLIDLLGFFEKKYQKMNSFTVTKSLAYFDDADLDPSPKNLTNITWEEVKEIIQEHLRNSV